MAQGFVTSLNLRESSTGESDRQIIGNLDGGSSIYLDISLFNGNTQHKSRLRNDPLNLGEVVSYGSFIPGKKYKIFELGDGRDWSTVGVLGEAAEDEFFTAIDDGSGDSGTGGIAYEIRPVREFNAVFDPSPTDGGWTLFVIDRLARTAFTEGTKISIDNGFNYDYVVVNSDARTRFQLAPINNPTGPVWDFSRPANENTPGDVDTLTLIRNDEITVTNINNAHVTPDGLIDQLDALVLGQTLSDDQSIATLSPDPWGDGGSIETIDTNLASIDIKKSNVILGYLDNHFKLDSGVRFDGAVRLVNNQNIDGYIRKIGIDTVYGELVTGETYRITSLGNTSQSNWIAAGSTVLKEGTQQYTGSGSGLDPNTVYEIINLGYRNVGTNGVFSFTNNELDQNANTFNLSSHGLSDGDVVVFAKVSGANLGNATGVGDLPYGTYYVKVVDSNNIKLSTNDSDPTQNQVDFFLSVSDPTGSYTFTTSTQSDWNTISGTTDATYTQRITSPSVTVGSYITTQSQAVLNTTDISGVVVSPIVFVATSKGTGTDTTAKARIVDSNGLYIRNPANGEAKRAFTGTDNPWVKDETLTLDIPSAIETRYTVDGTSGGSNKAGVNGSAGSRTLDAFSLKTTSDTAQAGNFVFDRRDTTDWGSFVVGESYTVTSVGSGRDWSGVFGTTNYADMVVGQSYEISTVGDSDWNALAGTTGENYSAGDVIAVINAPTTAGSGVGKRVVYVGSTFVATHAGPSGGSGGVAIGQPKILFTNTAQTELSGTGLGTMTGISANQFTHMIPITVNGESYQMLAFAEASDVTAGNYKIITLAS